MFQPPDDFDLNPNPFSNRANKERKLDNLSPEGLEDISPEDLAYRKQEHDRRSVGWVEARNPTS